jgi:hypothetical protein
MVLHIPTNKSKKMGLGRAQGRLLILTLLCLVTGMLAAAGTAQAGDLLSVFRPAPTNRIVVECSVGTFVYDAFSGSSPETISGLSDGEQVKVTALGGAGKEFDKWGYTFTTLPLPHSNPLIFSYDAAAATPVVGAIFIPALPGSTQELQIEVVDGPGENGVRIEWDGISVVCTGNCLSPNSFNLPTGSPFTITAIADGSAADKWLFEKWEGVTPVFPATEFDAQYSDTLSGPMLIRARFKGSTSHTVLTIDKIGTGTGSVNAGRGDLSGLGGGVASSFPAAFAYPDSNDTVLLNATPDAGSFFVEWQGDVPETTPDVVVPLAGKDRAQTVQFEQHHTVSIAGDAGAAEGDDVRFTVTLDRIAAQDVKITYDVVAGGANPASSPSDFAAGSGLTMSVAAGKQTADILVATVDEGIVESDETFVVNLVSVDSGNGNLSGVTSATGTITNNDTYTVNLAASPAADPLTEGNLTTLAVNVNPAVSGGDTVTVNFAAGPLLR